MPSSNYFYPPDWLHGKAGTPSLPLGAWRTGTALGPRATLPRWLFRHCLPRACAIRSLRWELLITLYIFFASQTNFPSISTLLTLEVIVDMDSKHAAQDMLDLTSLPIADVVSLMKYMKGKGGQKLTYSQLWI